MIIYNPCITSMEMAVVDAELAGIYQRFDVFPDIPRPTEFVSSYNFMVFIDVPHCHWLVQWIGLRENLQETIDFPMKYGIFL